MQQWRWLLDKHLLPRLGQKQFSQLKRGDIKECVRAIQASAGLQCAEGDQSRAGNRTANMGHGLVRRIYNWGIEEDRCDANPAVFRKLFDDQPVKRIGALNDERVRTLWIGLEEEASAGWGAQSVLAIQLVFLTLQRPNEVVKARREDFNWDRNVWRIPEDLTKTNDCYEVPLSDTAAKMFQKAFSNGTGKWAFPSKDPRQPMRPGILSHRFGKLRKRLVEAGKLEGDVELYDARRFGRTCIEQRLGFSEHIAEKVINHAVDRSMSRRYDVGDYTGAVRKAHEAWAYELERIVADKPMQTNVTQLRA